MGALPYRHPEEPRLLRSVSKDGRRRLWPLPSRLAVKNGEHLRMTLSFSSKINLAPARIEPRLGAFLVLVAPGCTGHADAAEQRAAGFDYKTAGQHGDARHPRQT